MNTAEEGLLSGIRASPDDAPRLIFSDYGRRTHTLDKFEVISNR